MKTIMTRFGEVEYNPENLLHFPEGMVGFEKLRNFIVMPNEKEGPLFWIQSVEDPSIAFVLTEPTQFYYDYKVIPDGAEQKKLAITEEDECFVLTVVTVSPEREITLNMMAPILFAPSTNRALQVILEGTGFNPKTPLPEVPAAKE